jgi:hypothetical protein
MDHNVTALERAFQLARSGECGTVQVIRERLKREGYSTMQIVGYSLTRQLRGLIAAARESGPKPTEP